LFGNKCNKQLDQFFKFKNACIRSFDILRNTIFVKTEPDDEEATSAPLVNGDNVHFEAVEFKTEFDDPQIEEAVQSEASKKVTGGLCKRTKKSAASKKSAKRAKRPKKDFKVEIQPIKEVKQRKFHCKIGDCKQKFLYAKAYELHVISHTSGKPVSKVGVGVCEMNSNYFNKCHFRPILVHYARRFCQTFEIGRDT
jgi:hypothetical protein